MSLREKIGQLLLYRLPWMTELTPELAQFLLDCHAGGVVLFGYNIPNLASVTRFNQDLQALARQHGRPPFIISVDEEGGQVSRIPADGQNLIAPSPMALARIGTAAVRDCATHTARLLGSLGFNLNYTPVLDINNNPLNPVIGTRSFGETPEVVSEMGLAAIEAYLQAGFSPCAKHFPGHGDTNVDSHYGLPVVNKSLSELRQFEWLPFLRAIEGGLPAIMSAHIVYPQLDPSGLPATLSRVFLTDILRHELKFEGLIITDALDMRAISDRYGLPQATIMALEAGADVIMALSDTEDWMGAQRATFEGVVAAVEAGQLTESAIDEKLTRLDKWRTRFAEPPRQFSPTSQDEALIASYARQSLQVVKDNDGLLPLEKLGTNRPLLIDFTLKMASPVEEGRQPGPLLDRELQRGLPTLKRLEIGANPTEAEGLLVLEQAAQSDLILLVSRNAIHFEQQAVLIQTLIAEFGPHTPLVAIAAREPYDLALIEAASTVIVTYGDPPATIRALASLLTSGHTRTIPTGALQ